MLHIEFNSALLFHRKPTNPHQISRIQLSSNGWRQKNQKTVEEFKTMVISSNPLAPELHISSHQQPYPSIPFSTDPNNVILPINRRHLLASLSVAVAPFFTSQPPDAGARGLFQMPPARLTNRYYLVRAGESEFESMGIINTNPVAKTSVDSGLSERGKKQTVRAAFELKAMKACEGSCWIWPSITQRAYQAAEIIASVNGVTRSFIVPEYSFLDARGLGAFEGKNLESVSEVYASDSISPSIKPPPINDGTPNESVEDVFVRVTQLMSILETQYSGDTVIVVSPDSDNLTVLQAGLVGLDFRRHRDLSFGPGEVRFVDINSIPTYKQPASAVYKCLNPPSCRYDNGIASVCKQFPAWLAVIYIYVCIQPSISPRIQALLFDDRAPMTIGTSVPRQSSSDVACSVTAIQQRNFTE